MPLRAGGAGVGPQVVTMREVGGLRYCAGMELAGLIVQLAILVATAGGAAVAWWKAIESSRDRQGAETAQTRAEDARDRATAALQSLASHSRPTPWADARQGVGDRWSLKNTSKRDVYVEAVEVEPEAAGPLLELVTGLPTTLSDGDTLELNAHPRYMLRVRRVVLVWRFADDDAGQFRRTPRELG